MSKNTIKASIWKDLPGLQGTIREVEVAAKWIQYHGDAKPVGIMIHGDTGAGKSYIKDKLIAELGYKDKEVLHLNAATFQLNRDLAWSELFGHKKGAFTDAKHDKPGVLAENHKAVVLDEFEMLPKDVQATLLVYLDTGSYKRLGATKGEHSRIHLILLTNQSPEEHQKEGLYRDDLIYRLYSIKVPSLNERRKDIFVLAHHLLEEYKKKEAKEVNLTVREAVALALYDWPGNVRQLRKFILRKCLYFGEGAKDTSHFISDEEFQSKITDLLVKIRKVSYLKKYSSLFPTSSLGVFETCDLAKIDIDFFISFLVSKQCWSSPRPHKDIKILDVILQRFKQDAESGAKKEPDFPNIYYPIRTPLVLKEEIEHYIDELVKETEDASYRNDLKFIDINRLTYDKQKLKELPPGQYPLLRKHLETIISFCQIIWNAYRDLYDDPKDFGLPIHPESLSQEKKSAVDQANTSTATIFLEQPWKKVKKELERQYWTYHLSTKGGHDLEKAVGIKQPSITRWRKKFDFNVSKN